LAGVLLGDVLGCPTVQPYSRKDFGNLRLGAGGGRSISWHQGHQGTVTWLPGHGQTRGAPNRPCMQYRLRRNMSATQSGLCYGCCLVRRPYHVEQQWRQHPFPGQSRQYQLTLVHGAGGGYRAYTAKEQVCRQCKQETSDEILCCIDSSKKLPCSTRHDKSTAMALVTLRARLALYIGPTKMYAPRDLMHSAPLRLNASLGFARLMRAPERKTQFFSVAPGPLLAGGSRQVPEHRTACCSRVR
jgi:hypothetical protein